MTWLTRILFGRRPAPRRTPAEIAMEYARIERFGVTLFVSPSRYWSKEARN